MKKRPFAFVLCAIILGIAICAYGEDDGQSWLAEAVQRTLRDIIAGLTPDSQKAPDLCPINGEIAVAEALKPVQQKHRVPAIAGLVLTSKGIEACGVVGVRKSGTDIPATVNDKWHLGSDTKAMTAALVGRLVERGLLKWDMPVADVFPDLAPAFHPQAKGVTIAHLLSHRAGLRANLNWGSIAAKGDACTTNLKHR